MRMMIFIPFFISQTAHHNIQPNPTSYIYVLSSLLCFNNLHKINTIEVFGFPLCNRSSPARSKFMVKRCKAIRQSINFIRSQPVNFFFL